jgi:hypothetical protein
VPKKSSAVLLFCGAAVLKDFADVHGKTARRSHGSTLLQVFPPTSFLQLLQDPADFLGSVAGTNQENIACFHDNRILHTQNGDEFLFPSNQAA